MDTKDEQGADTYRVSVADNKYTVILPQKGGLYALRYGEEWRDCTGDGLILALTAEIDTLREQQKTLMKEIERLTNLQEKE